MRTVIKNIIVYVASVSLLVSACRQNYNPPVIEKDFGILVVDGFLNNSSDTTFIRLSRTAKLQEGILNKGEKSATITINDASGNPIYYFQPFDDNGTYMLPGINLSAGAKYRLAINSFNGKQYLSDEITPVPTPPIDSISWVRKEDGVEIYTNTHDPANKTRYYRWDYTETWEYFSNFASSLKYESGEMETRTSQDQVFRCWTTRHSTDLLLASSAKLSDDIIYKNPIQFIPVNAVEINRRYSIFVRQYALSKDAFDFLVNLKKITEQRGSIFDAQPTELPGNIKCTTDPTEPVIGYIMASTMQTKRIFITNADVLPWRFTYYCEDPRLFANNKDTLEIYFGSGNYFVPIEEVRVRGILIGYNGGVAECVDCQLRGGKNVKPDFWP